MLLPNFSTGTSLVWEVFARGLLIPKEIMTPNLRPLRHAKRQKAIVRLKLHLNRQNRKSSPPNPTTRMNLGSMTLQKAHWTRFLTTSKRKSSRTLPTIPRPKRRSILPRRYHLLWQRRKKKAKMSLSKCISLQMKNSCPNPKSTRRFKLLENMIPSST